MIEHYKVTCIFQLIKSGTKNLGQQILDKQLYVLSGHISFVPSVTVEYKIDYTCFILL